MGPRLRRILATTAAVVAAVGLALVAILHLPPVRSRTLSWVVSLLESRYDLVLTADRLSYNLLTGGVTLSNVRLAAHDFGSQPFFTATRVHADLPLAAYAGRLILDDVVVEHGKLAIEIDASGRSNLPGGGNARPPAEPRALALRGLHLIDFVFRYDDRQTPMRIAATGVESALDDRDAGAFDGATGPFAVRGGVDVKWRDRALRVEPFETRLAFDGRNVSIEDLPLATTMGQLSVAGRLNRVLDALSLEIGFDGQLDVARAAEWAPPPIPVSGVSRVRGTLNGPPSAIEIVTRFDAASLEVGTEKELTASGELLVDRTRLVVNRLMASPHSGGEINAALEMPFEEAPLALTATWQGVDARALMRAANVEARPVGTRLDGSAKFTSGPHRSLVLKTDLTALPGPNVTPLAGALDASLRGQTWAVTHDLRADGVSVNGKAEGRLDPGDTSQSTIAGPSKVVIASLAAADRSLGPLGIRVPDAIRDAGGAIEADATISGTFSNPHATLVASAPAFEIPGVGPTAIDATVEADRSAVLVSPLKATRDGAEATGDVSIDLTSRNLGGSIHVTVPDARALQTDVPEQWRVSGALDAEATLEGTLDAPQIHSTLSSPALEFAGDSFTDLTSSVTFKDQALFVPQLSVRKDDGRLSVQGRFGLDRSYEASFDVTNLSWSRVLVGETPSRLAVDGHFAGTGTIDRPGGEGKFDFQLAGAVAGDLVGKGTLTVALNGDVARLTVAEPANALFANGTVALAAPYEYRGVAVINQLDIAKLLPLVEVEPGQVTGRLNATAAVTGAISGDVPPTAEANIQQVDARIAGVPLALVAPASISWQPGEITVRHLTASLGSGTLTADGGWGGRSKTVFSSAYRGEIEDLTTAAHAFGLDADVVAKGWIVADVYATSNRQDLVGSIAVTDGYIEAAEGVYFTYVNATAGITGESLTLHALTGRVDTATAGGSFAGKGAATIPDLDPMRATGSFVLDSAAFDAAGVEVKQTRPTTIAVANGLISMDDVVWEAAGSELGVGGSIDLSQGSPALNLSIQGIAVLRALSAFVPSLGVDGTAKVDVGIGGSFSNPDLSGRIELAEAEIGLRTPRIVVSDLSGPITFNGNRITLNGLSGSANGGLLTIDGGIILRGARIADGDIYVQAAGLAVEYPTGLRSEVDALLTYDVGGATPVLSGDVRVQRSAYTQPISLAALARANTGATLRPPGDDSALEELRLNVNVTTVEDIRIDNNYGRFEAGAQLRIVGTAAQPGMSGQVALREGGQIYALGRTFRLERGSISFTDLNRIQPDLDLQAITRVANLGDVTMTITGTPDRIEFDLTSEENASREEIATALLGGGATGANALALLSSDLLGSTGRQLGLDALRIEQGDVVRDEFREDPSAIAQDTANPVTRLTLSKRLRDNVEFTLSQNLAENGKTTFLVSYYPLPNLELRGISRDDGTQGAGVRHQITFGGDPARRGTVREPVMVAEVRVEGNLAPFTLDEIQRDLKVKTGDTLDFYDWQQDLDNLTSRYVERGHYEVRVRGHRDPSGDGAVAVTYAVTAGPATRIQVDGFELPKDDLTAIQESWSRGVFDRFIVEDAEARVHQRLISRGFVNGIVTGTMESSGDGKTLHLTVAPGTAAGSRDVRFTGNAGLSRNELEAAIQQSGMDVFGWIDRALLEKTLTAHYRNEGYLGATVSVGDPVLENGRGVLPVTIKEGVRTTIRAVNWSGLSDSLAETMRGTAALEAGAPYALASLDGARERVDRRYRTLGYNAVQVNATAVPVNDTPQVDVNLAVVQGPQQVLQDVETVGATRTREGIVRRALRLPVGRPVNLQEWALARKRLFDTNVFRSVDIQAVPIGDEVNGVQQVRARVTVEEYPPWRFRYGFQADRNRDESSVEGLENAPPQLTFGGIAEIRNQNLLGRALTGGLAARVELDFQRVNTFLQTASFFGLPFRSGLFIYGSRERVRQDSEPLFIEEIQGVGFEQRWRRRRGFEITYGYTFERSHVYDPEPPPGEIIPPLDQVLNDGRLTGAFLLDRRDEPVSPTRGTFSSVSVERAAAWLASDTSYTRLLMQQTGFWQNGPVVLASRVMAGRAWGSDIPLDQRFLAGGATTVRGYGENTLGPRDIFGLAEGGTELLVLNQELRFPLYRWFRGVGFFDVGNTYDATYPFSWKELKVGYGAGLRFDSPIGLLRLDFGIPGSTIPNSGRQPNTFSSGRWYFGIGHVF